MVLNSWQIFSPLSSCCHSSSAGFLTFGRSPSLYLCQENQTPKALKDSGLCESLVRDGNFGCGPTVTTEVCKDFSMTSLCWVLHIYMSLSTFTRLLVTYLHLH